MRESAPRCVASRSFSAELVVARPGHEEVRVHVSFRIKKNMQPRFSTSDLFDAFGDSCQSCGNAVQTVWPFHRVLGRNQNREVHRRQCPASAVLLETESEGEVLIVDGSGYGKDVLPREATAVLRLAFGIAEEVSEFANYQPREFGAIAFC
jgi:hypothetical protein